MYQRLRPNQKNDVTTRILVEFLDQRDANARFYILVETPNIPLQNQPIENQVNIVTTLVTRVPSRLSLSLLSKGAFPIISVISQVIRHIKFPCLISVVNFVLKSQSSLKKKKIKTEISQKNVTLLKISAKKSIYEIDNRNYWEKILLKILICEIDDILA